MLLLPHTMRVRKMIIEASNMLIHIQNITSKTIWKFSHGSSTCFLRHNSLKVVPLRTLWQSTLWAFHRIFLSDDFIKSDIARQGLNLGKAAGFGGITSEHVAFAVRKLKFQVLFWTQLSGTESWIIGPNLFSYIVIFSIDSGSQGYPL